MNKYIIIALLAVASWAHSQDTLWTSRYNGDCSFFARSCTVADSENIYIAGYGYHGNEYENGLLLKLSHNTGEKVWLNKYNGNTNGNDRFNCIAVDKESNIYVTGKTNNSYLTVKYNPMGETLWTDVYQDPLGRYSAAYYCVVDSLGNLYVTGGAGYDYLTIKYNSTTGETLWTKRYNASTDVAECAQTCAVDAAGNLFVSGYADNKIITIKYDAETGDSIWAKWYDGPGSYGVNAYSCAVDDSSYLYVVGTVRADNNNWLTNDYLIIKYDTNIGDTIWTKHYNGPANSTDIAYGCALDPSGYLFVTGSSVDNNYNWDYITLKCSTFDGEIIWIKKYDGAANKNDEGMDCAVDEAGHLFVTGTSYDSSGNQECTTIKYSSENADPIWVKREKGVKGAYDMSCGCSVDNEGYIYTIGSSYNGSNTGTLVVKSNCNTGDTIWVKRHEGDRAYSCRVENNNLYVVTKYSGTIKFSTSNGDIIWSGNYGGMSCDLDNSGNLFVTGYVYNGLNFDYLTVKYDTLSGDTIWTRRDDSYYNAEACGCVVDNCGYLYVTGTSDGSYFTIKYNALNGDTVWTRRYYDPSGQCEAASCAIDTLGNLYIAGTVNAMMDSTYLIIVKYDGNFGNIIWVKKYYDVLAKSCAINGCDLYVSGVSQYYNEIITIKYNAITGDSLGVLRYSLEPWNIGYYLGSALDESGNLYVTGSFKNETTVGHDILTIKYDMAMGIEEIRDDDCFVGKLSLGRNIPNPFNHNTMVEYCVPYYCQVEISIHNILGQKVKLLRRGYNYKGTYFVTWDGTNEKGIKVSEGIYFVNMKTKYGNMIKKIAFIR